MILIRYLIVLLLVLTAYEPLHAQVNPLPEDTVAAAVLPVKVNKRVLDSVFHVRQKLVTDSIITHTWLIPDSLLSSSIIIDSILQARVYSRPANEPWFVIRNKKKQESLYKLGNPLPKGQVWVIAVTGLLLVLFAVLRNSFSKQMQTIIQSFFSNRILNNLNKEDNLFTSWPFLLLFLQFGFTIGMFFYLVAQHYELSYIAGDFRFFITVSLIIVVLFALKIILLRLLGHLFNIQKPVHEYISILYLSYFNISLIFIPLVVAFALSPLTYGVYCIVISFILAAIIFSFQFIRAGVNILSHHRFSKVYLFLYFCALEICPILILIKAIGL